MRVAFVLLLLATSCQVSSQTKDYFTNPILAGFYPDPSICKAGDDYYLVTSTFSYYPGLPVFHSKDLVNWELVSHVLNKPELLPVEGSGVSRGLFAPSIRYNNGLFYVTCTLVDKGGNFVSISANPAGPWSDPIWIPQVNGIDPSPFFDQNGKAYIIYNSIPPDDKPLYNGHRTIRMYEFDAKTLKVLGSEMLLVNGGTDISKNPVWIEAPHIFQKDGFYYLICAEGGTGYQHSEVVFRSKSVGGPYEPYNKNPILTQRHLDPNRPNPITTTGHADFVETQAGEWWAVFLGCRPYADKDYYNIGRETFLAPVKWIDGWPVINPDFETVQYTYPLPLPPWDRGVLKQSGNFSMREDLDSDRFQKWMFLRSPKVAWHSFEEKSGALSIKVRPETCSAKGNPSLMARRQQHISSTAAVSMQFQAKTENEKAGLVIFQSENNFYFLCQSIRKGKKTIELFQAPPKGDSTMVLIASAVVKSKSESVLLKIVSSPQTFSFYYGESELDWKLLKDNVDPKFLSTKVAGGFVGSVYAMYATSQGTPSTNIAYFNWFNYQGNDDVYRK